MIDSNKFNVFLCLAVLTFTALSTEQPILSDHDTSIQAVTAQYQGNTNDDLELCLLNHSKTMTHEYGQSQYSFHISKQKYFNHLTKSARAPPVA